MTTIKPISSIHYCTAEQLSKLLDNLVEKNIISFYSIIPHIAEKDETKNHLHFYCIPNGRVDTDPIRDALDIADLNNLKPIRCLPFQCSKWDDWYLYGLHDKRYLASKMQAREFHYTDKDFVNSDDEFFNELIHTVNFTKFRLTDKIYDYAINDLNFADLVATGLIPIPQINQCEKMFNLIQLNKNLIRLNPGHDSVTESIDKETGEVMPWVEEVKLFD